MTSKANGQSQLVIKVKKESQSGLFNNDRLLLIKSGFISYYSKPPKGFVGNVRSLQISGDLPKFALSINDVQQAKIDGKHLIIKFKEKLIDRNSLGTMIQAQQSQMLKDNNNPKNKQSKTWNFVCQNKQFAKIACETVKVYMNNPQHKPSLQDFLGGYKSVKKGYRQMSLLPQSIKKIKQQMPEENLIQKKQQEIHRSRLSEIHTSSTSTKFKGETLQTKIQSLPDDVVQKINKRKKKSGTISVVSQQSQQFQDEDYNDVNDQKKQASNSQSKSKSKYSEDSSSKSVQANPKTPNFSENKKQTDNNKNNDFESMSNKWGNFEAFGIQNKSNQNNNNNNNLISLKEKNQDQKQLSFEKIIQKSQSKKTLITPTNNLRGSTVISSKILEKLKIEEYVYQPPSKKEDKKLQKSASFKTPLNLLRGSTTQSNKILASLNIEQFVYDSSKQKQKSNLVRGAKQINQINQIKEQQKIKQEKKQKINQNQNTTYQKQESQFNKKLKIINEIKQKKLQSSSSISHQIEIKKQLSKKQSQNNFKINTQSNNIFSIQVLQVAQSFSKKNQFQNKSQDNQVIQIDKSFNIKPFQQQQLKKLNQKKDQKVNEVVKENQRNNDQSKKQKISKNQNSNYIQQIIPKREETKTLSAIIIQNTIQSHIFPIQKKNSQKQLKKTFLQQPNHNKQYQRKQSNASDQKQFNEVNDLIQLLKSSGNTQRGYDQLFTQNKTNNQITNNIYNQSNNDQSVQDVNLKSVKKIFDLEPPKIIPKMSPKRVQHIIQTSSDFYKNSQMDSNPFISENEDTFKQNQIQPKSPEKRKMSPLKKKRLQLQILNENSPKEIIKVQTPKFKRLSYPSQQDIQGLVSSWQTKIPPSISKELNQITKINIDLQQCLIEFYKSIEENIPFQNPDQIITVQSIHYKIRVKECSLSENQSDFYHVFCLYQSLAKKIEKSRKVSSIINIAKVIYLRYKNFQGLAIQLSKNSQIQKLEKDKNLCSQLKYFLKTLQEDVPGLILSMLKVRYQKNLNILEIDELSISIIRSLISIKSYSVLRDSAKMQGENCILCEYKCQPKQIIKNDPKYMKIKNVTRQKLLQFIQIKHSNINSGDVEQFIRILALDNDTKKNLWLAKYFVSQMLGCIYQDKEWIFQGYAYYAGIVGRMISQSYEKFNKYLNNYKISEAKSVLSWQISKINTQNNLNHIDHFIEVCIKVCQVILSQQKYELTVSLCKKLLKTVPEYHIQRLRIFMILQTAYYKLQINEQIPIIFNQAVNYVISSFGQKSQALIPIYRTYALYLSKNQDTILEAEKIYLQCLQFSQQNAGSIHMDLVYFYLKNQQPNIASDHAKKAYNLLKTTSRQSQSILCLIKTGQMKDYKTVLKCLTVFCERGDIDKIIQSYKIITQLINIQNQEDYSYENQQIQEIFQLLKKAKNICLSKIFDKFIEDQLFKLPPSIKRIANKILNS